MLMPGCSIPPSPALLPSLESPATDPIYTVPPYCDLGPARLVKPLGTWRARFPFYPTWDPPSNTQLNYKAPSLSHFQVLRCKDKQGSPVAIQPHSYLLSCLLPTCVAQPWMVYWDLSNRPRPFPQGAHETQIPENSA